MRASGDRRSRGRFEVFGAFWGTFDAGDSVRVRATTTEHGGRYLIGMEFITASVAFTDAVDRLLVHRGSAPRADTEPA